MLIAKGNTITDDLRKMWQAEIDKYGSMVQEEVLVTYKKHINIDKENRTEFLKAN